MPQDINVIDEKECPDMRDDTGSSVLVLCEAITEYIFLESGLPSMKAGRLYDVWIGNCE